MSIIVQKFGGTSLSTPENRTHCYEHIKHELKKGNKVVVVVSAMGRKGDPYSTDTLLSLASDSIQPRERDLLCSAGEIISSTIFSSELSKHAVKNTVLTASQARILGTDVYGESDILSIDTHYIKDKMETFDAIIIPGFQSTTDDNELRTLGRGGSDTTACAIGHFLKVEKVEIFTDVPGIMNADPRIVSGAEIIDELTYDESFELSSHGAKVIHPKAVEIVSRGKIPLYIRSTFSKDKGTEIKETHHKWSESFFTGIANSPTVSQFTLSFNNDAASQQHTTLQRLKEHNISIDLINVYYDALFFTVSDKERFKTASLLDDLGIHYKQKDNCTKLSLIGSRITGVPGIMSSVFEELYHQKIPIYQSSDSHTTIWLLIDKVNTNNAMNALFNLVNGHKLFINN